jgi:hypothetical protein
MLELTPNTLPRDSVHVVDRHSRVTVVPRPSAELTVFYTHIQLIHVETIASLRGVGLVMGTINLTLQLQSTAGSENEYIYTQFFLLS